MNRILILDFLSVAHAIKFSLGKHKLSYKEKPTFIIYGFLLKLQFLIRKTRADVIVFALDSDKSLRKDIYPKYKEKRKQNKTEAQIALDKIAYPQFKEITDYVIPILGYKNIFEAEGFEADDIIAKICKTYKNDEIVICSTDHDLYQLLTKNVAMFKARGNTWYTMAKFTNEYGIEPKIWKRVKSFGGCFSDGVEGVPIPQSDPNKKQMHVAEKGALNFLKGNMKDTTKAYKAIVSKAGREVINRNKRLVILPFKGTPEFKIQPDHPKEMGLAKICEKYGFESILNDWGTWKRILKLR